MYGLASRPMTGWSTGLLSRRLHVRFLSDAPFKSMAWRELDIELHLLRKCFRQTCSGTGFGLNNHIQIGCGAVR